MCIRDSGYPPLNIAEIAAGQYKVDISCAGSIARSNYATVTAGGSAQALIR